MLVQGLWGNFCLPLGSAFLIISLPVLREKARGSVGGNEAFLNEQRGLNASNPLSCQRFSCGVTQLGPVCSQQSFFWCAQADSSHFTPPKPFCWLSPSPLPAASGRLGLSERAVTTVTSSGSPGNNPAVLGLTKRLPNDSDGRIPDGVEQPAGLYLVERSQFAAAEAPGPLILGSKG